jgi:C1A family cysteine protease
MIPSPQDDRDYKVTRLVTKASEFPSEFKIKYPGVVKDQGDVGSCMAHSIAETRETIEALQSKQYKQFSVGFVYGNREVPAGYDTEGMIPRDALKQLAACGDVYYEDFPFNEPYPSIYQRLGLVKAGLLEKANPHRITAYCRLWTLNDIKTALMKLGPVIIGIPVYDSFYNTGADGIVPVPDVKTETLSGYHAITVFGWTADDKLITLNHWGAEWGDKGWCYLPSEFIKLNGFEAWSITDTLFPRSEDPEQTLPEKKYYVMVGPYDSKDIATSKAVELGGKVVTIK